MKQLMNSLAKKDLIKERQAVLRLELDYELATLFDAMRGEDEKQVLKCKEKLNKIRAELLALKAL